MNWDAAAAKSREAGGERRAEDRALLREVLALHELKEGQREAFQDMLAALESGVPTLSARQRAWLREVHAKHVPQYENLVSSGKVSKVCTRLYEFELMPKPKKPPCAPKREDESEAAE